MNPITDIKEKARKQYSTVCHGDVSDAIIDAAALAVLDMVEGMITERESTLRQTVVQRDPEQKQLHTIALNAVKETYEALRAEIEGKKGCCEVTYRSY